MRPLHCVILIIGLCWAGVAAAQDEEVPLDRYDPASITQRMVDGFARNHERDYDAGRLDPDAFSTKLHEAIIGTESYEEAMPAFAASTGFTTEQAGVVALALIYTEFGWRAEQHYSIRRDCALADEEGLLALLSEALMIDRSARIYDEITQYYIQRGDDHALLISEVRAHPQFGRLVREEYPSNWRFAPLFFHTETEALDYEMFLFSHQRNWRLNPPDQLTLLTYLEEHDPNMGVIGRISLL